MLLRLLLLLLAAAFGGCDRSPPFQQVDGGWRYRGVAIDVDAASFVPLDEHHAREAQRVVFVDAWRESSDWFTTRHVRVVELAGADAARFEVLGGRYGRDGTRVFYEGRTFTVADVAGFVVLDDGFAHDGVQAYYLRQPIAGSRGAGFRVLGWGYASDGRSAFHAAVDYAAQPPRPHVRPLRGADAASLRVLDDGYAADAHRAYYRGRLIGPAPTLRALGRGYAKTESEVFYEGERVPDAHAPSFELTAAPTDDADARDARTAFRNGRRRG
jgi:hypothetical protein